MEARRVQSICQTGTASVMVRCQFSGTLKGLRPEWTERRDQLCRLPKSEMAPDISHVMRGKGDSWDPLSRSLLGPETFGAILHSLMQTVSTTLAHMNF